MEHSVPSRGATFGVLPEAERLKNRRDDAKYFFNNGNNMNILGHHIPLADFFPPFITRKYLDLRGRSRELPGTPVVLYHHQIFNSYSQFGEDLAIDLMLYKLKSGSKGIYIDVGANDPVILSNTKRFYDAGWRGINIEPHPAMYRKLVEQRQEDVNLRIGCGPTDTNATYYEMEPDTLSTFNAEDAKRYYKGKKLVDKYEIPVLSLSSVWKKYVNDREVDLLSVDVEGWNLAVLQGNDWNKNRPLLLLVEMSIEERPTCMPFIESNDYIRIYDNTLNALYVDAHKVGC